MKPFRFWVQTALPLVYDDSLSYYELLCKVVSYINNFMGDMQKYEGVIEEYTAKVDEIKKFVEGYFDSTDFQNLVNQTLDQMVIDGEFDAILGPVVNRAMQDVNDKLVEVDNVVDGFDDRVTAVETVTGQQGLAIANVREDVDNLEETVAGIIEGGDTDVGDKWKLVFVKGNAIGDCFYLCKEDTAILFDCGQDEQATALIASLVSHGISKVAAIVVSHWHSDHVYGLGAVLSDSRFSFTGCVMYKPHRNLDYNRAIGDWTSYVRDRDTSYTSMIVSHGGSAVYPDEGQKVEVEGLSLVFNNLSSSKFDNYYSVYLDEKNENTGETNYNNFCMITSVYCGGTKLAFSSDIMPEAQSMNRFFPAGASVYKVEHHGLNRRTDEQYANAIGADVSVVTEYGNNHVESMRIKTPTVNRCIGVGSLYDTINGDVEVTVSAYGVTCDTEILAVNSPLYHGELGGGYTVVSGTDFNNLIAPGIYSVQNYSTLQSMVNYPPEADSAGKLIVEAITTSGYINQYYIQGNSQVGAVHIRCRAWDETTNQYVWRRWRTLRPSYYEAGPNAQYYTSSISPINTHNENRYCIQNGFLNINFLFTTTEDITRNVSFFEMPLALRNGDYTCFNLYVVNSTQFYRCWVGNYNGMVGVWSHSDIPAGTQLYGYVTVSIWNGSPV